MIRTTFGSPELYLGQIFDSEVTAGGRHRLHTLQYRFTLTRQGNRESLLRWEYVRSPGEGTLWCRHHFQGPMGLPVRDATIPLDELHLPTGYVAFEEVIRFCIVDLGVPPLAENWDRMLRESYAHLKEDFTQ